MHMGKIAVFALLLFVPLALLGAIGCDGEPNGITGDDGGGSGGDLVPPPNPIGDRPNPLQQHIRAFWTGGDPNKTGGLHRDHIKVYGHCFTDIGTVADSDLQVQFIVDKFDVYMWGGTIVGQGMSALSSIWLAQTTDIPHIGTGHDSLMIARWLADPGRNPRGYRFDDLVLHYMYDVDTWLGATPGWNPADDRDGDRCADRPPSDPSRTAPCLRDAELHVPNYWFPNEHMWRAKIMHPGYTGFVIDNAVNIWNGTPSDGFHYDTAVYENWHIELGKTFTYRGYDEAAADFPMRTDLLLFVPTVGAAIESQIGQQAIHVANTVMPYYSCQIPESKELALNYLENTFNENWMVTNDVPSVLMTTRKREGYLDCPYLDWMEQDRGYVFACLDQMGSDRGKRFSLATFYLINHQMAFYYYRTGQHRIRDGEHVWDKQFNEYVDFDVGQPAANTLGLTDFQGNSGTDRYFVWVEHTDYEILGREYLRGDGQRVLVLVKLMAHGQPEGGSPTIHPLPGTYRTVLPSLTLGAPSNQVELRNNDGLILVEDGG
jgi:hypothetical protein